MAQLVPPVLAAGTLSATAQPTLPAAGELSLRPFRNDDVDAVMVGFSDPDIQHWHGRSCDSLDEALEWIELAVDGWSKETGATWAITDTTDGGGVVGRITFYPELESARGEIAYWVLPQARGRGVARHACRAVTDWAHDIGFRRVELEISTRNERSRRVALAVGFSFEGIRRSSDLLQDGWHDVAVFSHLSTD